MWPKSSDAASSDASSVRSVPSSGGTWSKGPSAGGRRSVAQARETGSNPTTAAACGQAVQGGPSGRFRGACESSCGRRLRASPRLDATHRQMPARLFTLVGDPRCRGHRHGQLFKSATAFDRACLPPPPCDYLFWGWAGRSENGDGHGVGGADRVGAGGGRRPAGDGGGVPAYGGAGAGRRGRVHVRVVRRRPWIYAFTDEEPLAVSRRHEALRRTRRGNS